MVRLVQSSFSFVVITGAIILCISGTYAGNTTCASNQLDWYTSVVGETPCDTYQRLRRICNPDYVVPNFRPGPPGDQCDDQVSACCCNTVAFQLSMLCMNCQYDTVDGNIYSGIDAGAGTYTRYRGTCGAGTNNSLPADIQNATCNENIRLDNFLYGGWDDGSWFYVFTKENASKDHAAHNNETFGHCPSQVSSSSSTSSALRTGGADGVVTAPTTTSSETSGPTASTNNSSGEAGETRKSNTGAIVGGSLGAVAGILLLGGLFMFWRTRRNRQSQAQLIQSRHTSFSSPIMSSAFPSSSIGAFRTPYSPPGLPSDEGGSSDSGHTRDPWVRRMSSYNTELGTAASMDSLRHEDAGLLEIFRSASGRLPPAYRSWGNQEYMFGPGRETQDSESQMYPAAASERRPAPDVPVSPAGTYISDDYVRTMPLAPLRRAPTRAY